MYKNMDQTGWYQTKWNKISTEKQILPDLLNALRYMFKIKLNMQKQELG